MDIFKEYKRTRKNKNGKIRYLTELNCEPSEVFKNWFFQIKPFHYEILGIRRGFWLDEKINTPLRELRTKELIDNGYSQKKAKSQATKEIQHTYSAIGSFAIEYIDFAEGYSFISKSENEQIQIIDNSGDLIAFSIFNHELKKYSHLFLAKGLDFVLFLKNGDKSKLNNLSPHSLRESDLKYLLIKDIKNTFREMSD